MRAHRGGFTLLAVLVTSGGACGGGRGPSTTETATAPGLAVRALEPATACTAAAAAIYRAGPTTAPRGALLACSDDGTRSIADLSSRANLLGYVGPALTSTARVLRVAYRTERLAGQPGVGTALVYLPGRPRAWPVPAVVVAHGTIGLADVCAPSRKGGAFVDELALPLVGAGFAVIAPDYAGLGNGRGRTYQGWGIAEDQAHSVLDAARALQHLVAPGALGRFALVGHSQGGGAVLAAQAALASDGADLDVASVVAFAPGWYDARIFGRILGHGDAPLRGRFEVLHAFAAMWFFAHSAVYDGTAAAADAFAAPLRAAVTRAMDQRCILTLGADLARAARSVGELYDPAFVASVQACLGPGPCSGPGQRWLERVIADRPTLSPDGPPVVLIQGLLDGIVTPSATRCTLDRLQADHVPTHACTLAGTDHFSVLGRAAPLLASILDGNPLTCANTLPACAPVDDILSH